MTIQEFVNIDKDLQTVQDISDVNIIILIYLFIKHVLFIPMYLYKCKMHVIWSHNFRFSMSLSLSPNSFYRLTTDCTEGGGLTREHCIEVWHIFCYIKVHITTNDMSSNLAQAIQHYVIKFASDLWQVRGFLSALRFPPPIQLTPLKFVESGVKHKTQ